MKKIKILIFLSILIFLATPGTIVIAGSSQATGEMYFEPPQVMQFAKKVEKTLASKGARVAILARLGRPQDTLPEGINFTHVGIAVYSQIKTQTGDTIPGYSIYNLYQSAEEPDKSNLIQDFPVDFFAGVQVLKAGVIIPTPELQRRILKVLTSSTYRELHNPKYSVLANPFTLELQNCTEHTLDVITAAIYQTNDLNLIKANEKAYFEPQPITINPFKLLIGSMLSADVTTSDHPGNPVTTTFTTIERFLAHYNGASEVLTVSADI